MKGYTETVIAFNDETAKDLHEKLGMYIGHNLRFTIKVEQDGTMHFFAE